MQIIEYSGEYEEQVKDLLVELQKYLVDIDDWNTQVLLSNYREDYFKMDMEQVKNHEGKIYLAKEEDKIIGMVLGIIHVPDEIDKLTNDCAKSGSVEELIISPSARGNGIGNQLLAKIEEYFESKACKRITIEVFGPNQKALGFYNKNGYVVREVFVSKEIKK